MSALRGRVCARSTIFTGPTCLSLEGARVTVSVLGTQTTAVVGTDGTFELPAETPRAEVQLVTSPGDAQWFPGAVAVDLRVAVAGGIVVPVVPRSHVEDLLQTNRINANPEGAILVVHVGEGQRPATGATLSAISGVSPLYDTVDLPLLEPDTKTGSQGTAVYFGLPAAPARFTAKLGSQSTTVQALPLASPALQFHEVTF
jgi:hypothetical protein